MQVLKLIMKSINIIQMKQLMFMNKLQWLIYISFPKLNNVLQSGYYKIPLGYDNVVCG